MQVSVNTRNEELSQPSLEGEYSLIIKRIAEFCVLIPILLDRQVTQSNKLKWCRLNVNKLPHFLFDNP